MKRPGWNHLDRQRLLLSPRDYASDPHRFGLDPDLTFHTPPGGSRVSQRAADVQHRLVLRWRTMGTTSGAQLARRYGLSKQTWSRMTLGERWAGQVLLTALLDASRPGPPAGQQSRGSVPAPQSVTRPGGGSARSAAGGRQAADHRPPPTSEPHL